MDSTKRRLPVAAFSPAEIPAGGKEALALEVVARPTGDAICFPTLVARGAAPGKVLVAIGGVHGDEFDGPVSIAGFFSALDPHEMSGTFVGVPVVNAPAFEAGTRNGPFDCRDLARCFPGDDHGTVSERIAALLLDHVVAHADLLVDLHSGGRDYDMPTMAGYYALETDVGRRSREAAFAFGAETVWGSPLNRGRSISEAVRRGVPSIYAESGGHAGVHFSDVEVYRRGLGNLLKHLGVLPGEPERSELRYSAVTAEEDYWRESAVLASASGLYVSRLEVLAEVGEGQELGRVVDLFGETKQVVRSARRGRVMAQRVFPRVFAGDALVIIA
jgi:predicted deacylase